MPSNAEHMKEWLLGCGAIDASRGFGLDFLGESPGCWALFSAASPLAHRENILGQSAPREVQAREFVLACRAAVGADGAGSASALRRCEAVARWIGEQCAAGNLPAWEGGVVTGVVPAATPAPGDYGAGTARYQMRILVKYRVE